MLLLVLRGNASSTVRFLKETLINGGDATVCGLGERFSCQSHQLTAAGGSGWPGVVRRTQVSCGRDTGLRAPTARTPGPRSWRCRDSAPCDSRTGTSVWTGRALQAKSDGPETIGLRFCIRPLIGTCEFLGHYGYPRASDLIHDSAPKARSAT